MSTDYTIHKQDEGEVVITARSASDTSGPQQMSASEALSIAAGIIYAVWCSDPDEANALVASMAGDHIPDVWNKIATHRR